MSSSLTWPSVFLMHTECYSTVLQGAACILVTRPQLSVLTPKNMYEDKFGLLRSMGSTSAPQQFAAPKKR